MGERHGVAIVPHLQNRIDLLPDVAIALAEIAMVVDDGSEPRSGKNLGVAIEVLLLQRCRAMRHDNSRKRPLPLIGDIVPAAKDRAFRIKLNVGSHLSYPTSH